MIDFSPGAVEPRWKWLWKRCLWKNGAVLRLLSTVVFYLELAMVKKISPRVIPIQILIVQAIATGFLLIIKESAFHVKSTDIFGSRENMLMLFAMGLLTFLDNAASWVAVARMPIGDASAILFSTPAITSTVALFLGMEKWSFPTPIGIIVSIIGVFLVARPPMLFFQSSTSLWTSNRVVGMIFAFLGMFASSGIFLLRKLSDRERVAVILIWQNGLALLFSLLFLFLGIPDKPSYTFTWLDIVMTVLVALIGSFAWMLVYQALKFSTSSLVSVLGAMILVWSYAGDVVIFGDPVSIVSIVGAACIVAASITISTTVTRIAP
ncbi:hypothetical protein BSKO_12561 [Bryopsis sp. KO-2023]|nr:hypothetical protein BSKO_12561 [Bryopsis sp. KO-2023]